MKTAWQGLALALVAVLALRGAAAFYVQFQERPAPPETPGAHGRPAHLGLSVEDTRKQVQVAGMTTAGESSTRVVVSSPGGASSLSSGTLSDVVASDPAIVQRGRAGPDAALSGQSRDRSPGSASQTAARAAEQSAGFIEGRAGPVWTAFVDGNCVYCAQLWRQLRAPLAEGRIRVRWVPVAVLGPTSTGKAAALLQSAAPLELLAAHAMTGAAAAGGAIGEITRTQIEMNNAILKALSPNAAPVTPTLVVPTRAAGRVVIRGVPPDLLQVLSGA